MKKSIIVTALVLLALGAAVPALADTTSTTPTPTSTPSGTDIPQIPAIPAIESAAPQSENAPTSAINGINNLAALQARGAALIAQRIRGLNRLNQKLDKSKLADADKAALKTEVTANITNLTALGEKIKADTDLAVAKADVISIFETYRIYAVFMPKINGIMSALLLEQHAATLTSGVVAKYDAQIAALKASGRDTTAADTLMADAKAKIADSLNKANSAQAGFATLLPANYPATNAVIKTNAKLLKDSRASLKTAEKDLAKIRVWLKGMVAKQKLEAQKQKLQEKFDAAKKKLENRSNAQKQKLEQKFQKRIEKKSATGTNQ